MLSLMESPRPMPSASAAPPSNDTSSGAPSSNEARHSSGTRLAAVETPGSSSDRSIQVMPRSLSSTQSYSSGGSISSTGVPASSVMPPRRNGSRIIRASGPCSRVSAASSLRWKDWMPTM